jgi:nucleotide-binding universal stress UspA family protein
LARTEQVLTRAGFRVQTVLEKGDPRAVTVNQASQRNTDLFIMGSHGLKGLDRLLIGSVSEAVLRHEHCSVDIVRIPQVPSTSGI